MSSQPSHDLPLTISTNVSPAERAMVETCLSSMACAVTHNPRTGQLEEPAGLRSGFQLVNLMAGSAGGNGKCWTFPCYSLKHHQQSATPVSSPFESVAGAAGSQRDKFSLEHKAAKSMASPLHASLAETPMIPKFILYNIYDTFQSLLLSRLRSYLAVLSKQAQQQQQSPTDRLVMKQILQFLLQAMDHVKNGRNSTDTGMDGNGPGIHSQGSAASNFIRATTIVNRFQVAHRNANDAEDQPIMCIPGQGFMVHVTQQTTMDVSILGEPTTAIQIFTTGNLFGYLDTTLQGNLSLFNGSANPGKLSHVSLSINMDSYLQSLSQQIKLLVRNAVRKAMRVFTSSVPNQLSDGSNNEYTGASMNAAFVAVDSSETDVMGSSRNSNGSSCIAKALPNDDTRSAALSSQGIMSIEGFDDIPDPTPIAESICVPSGRSSSSSSSKAETMQLNPNSRRQEQPSQRQPREEHQASTSASMPRTRKDRQDPPPSHALPNAQYERLNGRRSMPSVGAMANPARNSTAELSGAAMNSDIAQTSDDTLDLTSSPLQQRPDVDDGNNNDMSMNNLSHSSFDMSPIGGDRIFQWDGTNNGMGFIEL